MTREPDPRLRARGSRDNIANRFRDREREAVDEDEWQDPDWQPQGALPTVVTEIEARSILRENTSPDLPFAWSINPYQGCEHGCIYCYARPSHAYLDLSPGLDFETRLFAKTNAARLLRRELARPGYRPGLINLGSNTDCYQPIEQRYRLTRQILEVLLEARQPLTLITKSTLVTRDIDLLQQLATEELVQVVVSLTSLDKTTSRRLEARAAAPAARLKTLKTLNEAGIPTGVLIAPLIPMINDHELEALTEAAAEAGAWQALYITLRLPLEVLPLFEDWLQAHYPDRAERVMARVRDLHGGRAYRSEFGHRMSGSGELATLYRQRFRLAVKRYGLNQRKVALPLDRFRPPSVDGQMSLF